VVFGYSQHSIPAGVTPTVVAYQDPHSAEDVKAYPDITCVTVPNRPWGRQVLRPTYVEAIDQAASHTDLIHTHGLWLPLGRDARIVAERRSIPLVISPHGMLEPYSINRSRLKKRIARLLYESRNLKAADCFLATAPQEANNLRAIGITQAIGVVGIGLNAQDYLQQADDAMMAKSFPKIADRKILLFMSRIHPKKGLLKLASIWGRLGPAHEDWVLVIAGPDELGHEAEVKQAISDAGVTHQTLFVGPVQGEHKQQLLAASDLFVLPTFSENFGIVVAEALASGSPVLTTDATPWHELNSASCGWLTSVEESEIEKALAEALALPGASRHQMGERGQKLIQEKYSWPAIGQQLADIYQWVCGHADKPEHSYGAGEPVTIPTGSLR